jgi:hypothetical protein
MHKVILEKTQNHELQILNATAKNMDYFGLLVTRSKIVQKLQKRQRVYKQQSSWISLKEFHHLI